jgi:hypothetical protein
MLIGRGCEPGNPEIPGCHLQEDCMQRLSGAAGLVVSRKKEWGEILTGFETRNRYKVFDSDGRELFLAAEEGSDCLCPGARIVRQILRRQKRFQHQCMT